VTATFVQEASITTGASTSSGTANFGVATTAGNLLVAFIAGDKDTGSLTATGWTVEQSMPSTSVSLYQCWKISTGESSASFSWANSSLSGSTIWCGEYVDVGVVNWTMLGKGSNITSEANVSSWSTGSTTATLSAGLAIAGVAIDSRAQAAGTLSWTNDYTSRFGTAGGASEAYVFVAEKVVAPSEMAETTFSYSAGGTDQLSGCIAAFGGYQLEGGTQTLVARGYRLG